MAINPQMNMCIPPPMNGPNFMMPAYFPSDQYGMMMPNFAPTSMLNSGWGPPPPPPPPPPPVDSSGGLQNNYNYGQSGSEQSLESDSRKRGGRSGGLGSSSISGSGYGPDGGFGSGGGGLGSGADSFNSGGLGSGGGLGSDDNPDGPRPRGGRDRRRRGRGRDHDDYSSGNPGGGLGSYNSGGLDGGLGQATGGLASGGLGVPHGNLLPRMLPPSVDDLGGQSANFTAFGSYGPKNRRQADEGGNYDNNMNGVDEYYGHHNMGPGRPFAGMDQVMSNGAPANGSMGYRNDRQANRQRR